MYNELGLNVTAMDYRQYDNAIGRFNCIDALAESTFSISPYAFANNNPNYFVDPSGLHWNFIYPTTINSGNDAIDQMWLQTASGGESSWSSAGNGDFRCVSAISADGTGSGGGGSDLVGSYIFADGTFFTGVVNLPELIVKGNSNSWASQIEQHVYDNSPYYNNSNSNLKTQQNSNFDIDMAVDWLNNNAHSSWKDAKGQCAAYIRQALEAGGLNTSGHPVPAWKYSSFLPKLGFTAVNTNNYIRGDIAVIKGYPGASSDPITGIPYGHIEMFNGFQWISDFKQNSFWPGSGYRTNQPEFEIFRWVSNP